MAVAMATTIAKRLEKVHGETSRHAAACRSSGNKEWVMSVLEEELFDRQGEDLGDQEGERQAGVVAFVLDRVDGLPRDAETLAELGLGPASLGAQFADVVFHW